MSSARLRVREIFCSVQGESTFAGWPCVFVRMAGCDLRCAYCDEPQAFAGGESVTVDRILARIRPWGIRLVEVTGGEPLLQRPLPDLVRRLLDADHEVLVETGGHHDISVLDPRAHVILDVKTPGSGMHGHFELRNLEHLGRGDEVKLVLCDRSDYEWAREWVRSHDLAARFPVHFSPVHPGLDPRDLVKWILDDALPVRLNLQLHKYVWPPGTRQV